MDSDKYARKQAVLRVLGILVILAGLIFFIVGTRDFNSAALTRHKAKYLWCILLGYPLLIIGGVLIKAGFFWAAARKRCPACNEMNAANAHLCDHCGRSLSK